MYRAVLIDDEEYARQMLRSILGELYGDQIEILGEADGVRSGIQLIDREQPELVFLDIQMPDGTGFDVIRSTEFKNYETVFITAHNEFAVKAFECSAFGYLMKPMRSTKLAAIVDKFIQGRAQLKQSSSERTKVLIENFGDRKIRKLVIRNEDGFKVLEIADIFYLQGEGSYSLFVTATDAKILASKNLANYERLLNEFGFFRIHQGYLVNLSHVKQYSNDSGGMIIMKNGDELKLSRHRKSDFIAKFV